MNNTKTVIFDIDGVLCNPKTNEPMEAGLSVYVAMSKTYPVIFLTHREESKRKETLKWLKDNIDSFITNDQLVMRIPDVTDEEYPTPEQKVDLIETMFDKDEVLMVFDDETPNIKAFREAGLTAYQTL